MTLYRAFSGLIPRQNHARTDDIEHQAILATSIQVGGSESYKTLFLMAAEEGGELQLVFFNRVRHEFNKVDRFYWSKVQEVVSEAETLSKQMDMLIAFRVKVGNLDELLHETKPTTTTPVAPVEILNNVKLNKILDTPLSVIEGCLDPSNQVKPNFSRKNLKKAEKQLQQAFIEFYHKLQLLKNYRYLNMLSLTKIMKKYDKIASRNTSRTYMNMVDKSYLDSSDEVLDVLLRFAWLQTVLDFQVSFLHRQTLISIVASLEIIRRGLWNFFRLENEHLHNVGKYHAFKFVPLPFELDVGAESQEQ